MAHPTLLTLDEAAARLTIARKTLRDWLKTKPPKLRGVKIGREWRIAEHELDAFLARALGVPAPEAPEAVSDASQGVAPETTTMDDATPTPAPAPLHLVPTPAQRHKPLSQTRARIVELLHAHPEGLTPAQVKAALRTDKDQRNTMKGMLADGILRRPDDNGYGRYIVADEWRTNL
jgi:excisionase family DNA binding protein